MKRWSTRFGASFWRSRPKLGSLYQSDGDIDPHRAVQTTVRNREFGLTLLQKGDGVAAMHPLL